MRYPPEHKEESRRVLLEAARVLFRREGFERPSIDRITGAAGLTRGTFYAHFASKRALVAEVLALEPGLIAEVRDAAGPAGVRDVLRSYLEPARRTEVLDNCALAAHPVDVRRSGEGGAYATHLEGLVAALRAQGVEAALEVAVTVVGAAVLAGAVEDGGMADAIEGAAVRRVEGLLGGEVKR